MLVKALVSFYKLNLSHEEDDKIRMNEAPDDGFKILQQNCGLTAES